MAVCAATTTKHSGCSLPGSLSTLCCLPSTPNRTHLLATPTPTSPCSIHNRHEAWWLLFVLLTHTPPYSHQLPFRTIPRALSTHDCLYGNRHGARWLLFVLLTHTPLYPSLPPPTPQALSTHDCLYGNHHKAQWSSLSSYPPTTLLFPTIPSPPPHHAPTNPPPTPQALSTHDCLYGNRHRARWLLFADLDEFVEVLPPATLQQLLQDNAGRPWITFGCTVFNSSFCRPQEPWNGGTTRRRRRRRRRLLQKGGDQGGLLKRLKIRPEEFQALSTHDCLYGNRHRARWLLFADLDEFVEVLPPATLQQLLQDNAGRPWITFGCTVFNSSFCRPQEPWNGGTTRRRRRRLLQKGGDQGGLLKCLKIRPEELWTGGTTWRRRRRLLEGEGGQGGEGGGGGGGEGDWESSGMVSSRPFIVEGVRSQWPHAYCMNTSLYPDHLCLDQFGHRKYVLNPRRVSLAQVSHRLSLSGCMVAWVHHSRSFLQWRE
ncbi:unnamed protein product [Closterium sp. NIES-53]